MYPIITTSPSQLTEVERRIAIVSYKSSQAHTHQRSCTHPCNFAMRCSSLSSLPLNPLAKGLFSIFSCVIWGQSRAIFYLDRSAGPKACSVFCFEFFRLTKSMVYYYSEALQVLKGGLLELCMANIPQPLTFLTERTVFSPADTE